MIKKLHALVIQNKNKQVVKNSFYMSLFQIFNYVFPAITFAYLARVLGVSNFGLVMLSVAVANYFAIVVDWGFMYSAVRTIALNKHNPQKVSQTASAVIVLKILFFLAGAVVFAGIVFAVPALRQEKLLYFLAFLGVLWNVFFAEWIFQAFEEMRYTAYFSWVMESITLGLVIFFVRAPSDYVLVVLIGSCVAGVGALVSCLFAFKKFKLKFKIPPLSVLKENLREGLHFFNANVSLVIGHSTVSVMLGFFVGYAAVGYYTAAKKILIALRLMAQPVASAVYPYILRKFESFASGAVTTVKKVLIFTTTASFALCALVFIWAGSIVRIIWGESYVEVSGALVRAGLLMPVISSVYIILMTHILMPLRKEVLIGKIFFSSVAISVVLSFVLIKNFGALGAMVSVTLFDACIAAGVFVASRKAVKSIAVA
ncbi:MAG: oligosaccharide flippase family protein [Elusimicrobia bacterium]|nr:oligosaccharide flippase family protein [Elusimicrobiota bacterium]